VFILKISNLTLEQKLSSLKKSSIGHQNAVLKSTFDMNECANHNGAARALLLCDNNMLTMVLGLFCLVSL
jgi:hypothetical protein